MSKFPPVVVSVSDAFKSGMVHEVMLGRVSLSRLVKTAKEWTATHCLLTCDNRAKCPGKIELSVRPSKGSGKPWVYFRTLDEAAATAAELALLGLKPEDAAKLPKQEYWYALSAQSLAYVSLRVYMSETAKERLAFSGDLEGTLAEMESLKAELLNEFAPESQD